MTAMELQDQLVFVLNETNRVIFHNRFCPAVCNGEGITTLMEVKGLGTDVEAFQVEMEHVVILCAPEYPFRRPLREMRPDETAEDWNRDRPTKGPRYEVAWKIGPTEIQEIGVYTNLKDVIRDVFNCLVDAEIENILHLQPPRNELEFAIWALDPSMEDKP